MTTNSFANLPVNTPQYPAIPTRPPRFPADRSRAGQRRARANSPGAAHIRSFVHRRGHITQGQLAALEQLLGKWSLPYAARRLDPAAAFGREAPTVLEIGFGMGETTEKIALARPGDNFLGVEVFNAGGSLLRRIEDSSIQNLRIIQHDAVEVVRDMIAPIRWPACTSISRPVAQEAPSQAPPDPAAVHLAAGQPHRAGRLHPLRHRLAGLCRADARSPGQRAAAEEHRGRLRAAPRLPPQTKFETRGLRLGHGVWDLIFKRVA